MNNEPEEGTVKVTDNPAPGKPLPPQQPLPTVLQGCIVGDSMPDELAKHLNSSSNGK